MKRLPIGISDFKELVQNDYYFVDTSKFIGDIYRDGAKILLLTRPRRFGKTLNMSMLSYFFDNRKSSSELFEGLAVSDDSEVMGAVNSYPTILISFKDIKDRYWDTAEMKLKNLISKLYNDFYDSIKSVLKPGIEVKTYESIINKESHIADYQDSLKYLTEYLYRAFQKPARNILYDLANPLITGDGELFCEKLKKYVLNTLSYYWSFKETPGSLDYKTPDLKGEPENTYHMILLGMFAHLTGGYWILSNRESGKGRFDLCLKAKNKEDYSAVIEIKPKGTQKAADDGMVQIEDKMYVQDLISEGYTKILKISLAVDGKDIVARVKE